MTESLIDESDITIDDNTEILGTRRIIILCDSKKIANKQVKEILENAEIVKRLNKEINKNKNMIAIGRISEYTKLLTKELLESIRGNKK